MARRLISSGSTFESQIGYSRAVVSGSWVFVSGCTGYAESLSHCTSLGLSYIYGYFLVPISESSIVTIMPKAQSLPIF